MSFTPTILTTLNIAKSLEEFAKKEQCVPEDIAFEIVAFATYYAVAPQNKWTKIEAENRASVVNVATLTNPLYSFTEQYKIKLFPNKINAQYHPILALITSKDMTKINLVLRKGSTMVPDKLGAQFYLKAIKAKLAQAGVLLGLFGLNIEKNLAPLWKAFTQNNTLQEDIILPIIRALPAKLNEPKRLVSHYLSKHSNQRTALESGVDEGELIAQYYPATFSTGGRNSKGEYLFDATNFDAYDTLYTFDAATIRRTVQNDVLSFYALKTGFVDLTDQHFAISNSLTLGVASLKSTGSITPGGHRDIDIKIVEDDINKDAIEKGVAIDVSTINVRGSIASNTSIKAQTVEIGAQTHKKSTLEVAETAKVHLHRGNLKAKDAHINKFENGTVEAHTAHINDALGGVIIAKEIHIRTLYSNATLIASHEVSIGSIVGQNNKIYIAPYKVPAYALELETLRQEIADAQNILIAMQQEERSRIIEFEASYARLAEYQKKAVMAIKQGQEIAVNVAVKLKQHTIDREQIDELTRQVQLQQQKVATLQNSLDRANEIWHHASVKLLSSWDGKQAIIYDYDPEKPMQRYMPNGLIKEIVYDNINKTQLLEGKW
ncbi:MAG: hypothetical protein KU37_05560 [Sulfuricurvum sp. PC08-66]|nr:MAG: hypothetical protein KU37_05560 [Sulfuricurvum sp. PC08-66]